MTGTLATLIHHYGVLGVALGAGFEREAAVITGGVLARHGAFNPIGTAIAAWLGSFAADQVFFALGRSQRDSRFVARVARKAAFNRALAAIERHPVAFCIAFRFVYGFRVAGPVAIGVSHVPARLFLLLNSVSAALWAALFTALGYCLGATFERALRGLLTPAHLAIAVVAAAVLLAAAHLWRQQAARASRLS
ncbi:MAG: DedA family protein [Sphingomonadaceae bacterium]|nr:DedA family protein [Sphingomonadaceae bacterium]